MEKEKNCVYDWFSMWSATFFSRVLVFAIEFVTFKAPIKMLFCHGIWIISFCFCNLCVEFVCVCMQYTLLPRFVFVCLCACVFCSCLWSNSLQRKCSLWIRWNREKRRAKKREEHTNIMKSYYMGQNCIAFTLHFGPNWVSIVLLFCIGLIFSTYYVFNTVR